MLLTSSEIFYVTGMTPR